MKKQKLRMSLIYILVIILFFVVIGIVTYVSINKTYMNKMENNIKELSVVENLIFEKEIETSYFGLEKIRNNHATIQDTLNFLEAEKENIHIKSDLKYTGFGEVKMNSYSFESVEYLYSNDYIRNVYYNQPIAVFNFEEAFLNGIDIGVEKSKESFIFYRVKDLVVYFEAEEFFASIFKTPQYESMESYLSTSDGYIYESSSKVRGLSFVSILGVSGSTKLFQEIQTVVDQSEVHSGVYDSFGVNSFLFASKVESDLFALDLIWITIIPKQAVIDGMASIILTTISMGIAVLLISISFFLLFTLVVEKNKSDIEFSKRQVFYAKPYIISVDDHGNIKNVNNVFKENLKPLKEKKLSEFFVLEYDEKIDLERQSDLLLSFYDLGGVNLVDILFFIVKNEKGFDLIGKPIKDSLKTYQQNELYYKYIEYNLLNEKTYEYDLLSILLDKTYLKQKMGIVSIKIKYYGVDSQEEQNKLRSDTIKKILKETGQFDTSVYIIKKQINVIFKNLTSHHEISDFSDMLTTQIKNLKVAALLFEGDNFSQKEITEKLEIAIERAEKSNQVDFVVYHSELEKGGMRK